MPSRSAAGRYGARLTGTSTMREQHSLPRRAPAIRLDDRQQRKAGTAEIVAIQPRDRHEMRNLPHEHDGEERPGFGRERAAARRPTRSSAAERQAPRRPASRAASGASSACRRRCTRRASAARETQRAGSMLAATIARPMTARASEKITASVGVIRFAASGRMRVRHIRLSVSRSYT